MSGLLKSKLIEKMKPFSLNSSTNYLIYNVLYLKPFAVLLGVNSKKT